MSFLLLNGSFGIGKSTVAAELRRQIPGSRIFDPEWIGFVLRRLPGYRRSDYQQLSLWRRLTVRGARVAGLGASTVIVPMAFSEPRYLGEVLAGLRASGRQVHHFCLTAPLDVVRERLRGRGEPSEDPRFRWVHRRAQECCLAHTSPDFAVQIATGGRSPSEIAGEIRNRARLP